LRLAYPLVIAEDESSVLANRAAGRGAELVASVSWFWLPSGIGEEVVRVQRRVAQALVDVAMERVGPRLADGVDNPAGGPSIFGRVVAGDHGEFLNRIHAQADSDHAARAVGVIVDAEPVDPVVVLRGPASRDGHLKSKAPVPADRAVLEGHLGFDRLDAGGKSGQRRPVAAVQGQLAHGRGLDRIADGGRRQLYQRRRFRHLDELSAFSDLHRYIELLLSPDPQRDVRLHYGAESWLRSCDVITAGLQIRGGVKARFICHNGPDHAGSLVFD